MCRIAGIISNTSPTAQMLASVKTMCQTLAHGGPDDEGIYAPANRGLVLGHRRLAIIDLSANGHQPMADADQKAWITFNGEIYNYPELRAELLGEGAVFKSDSDTEVIIQAYLHWSTKAFSRLRGIFAFALYDTINQLTYLVRDTSGIKPLYYHITAGQLSFASETKALKEAGLATEADTDWPVRFLAFGHIPEPYTTLKDVCSLSKGHYLCWDHLKAQHIIVPYFPAGKVFSDINDVQTAQQTIRQVLDQTIKRQLLADAPIGVFLSGGIDSSLLTLLAHRHKKDHLETVSIFFDERNYDERKFQNIVLEKTGVKNHPHLVKQQDFEDALPQIIADMDMPTTDGINSWFISKYAHADGLKAVLSGLGGDELFGGYPSFKRIKFLKYLKLIPAPILNFVAWFSIGRLKRLALLTQQHPLAEYLFLRGLFAPADIAKILNIDKKQVLKVLFATPLNLSHLSDSQKAAWFETNLYMQNQLLRDTDVMSMAHGLEVRVPFLDEDFVQAVSEVSPAIRFNNNKPKQLLIDSYEGLLPRGVWDRPKMGFSFPLQQWMQDHQQIGNVDFYKSRYAKKLIGRFGNQKVHWSRAFALYQLQLNKATAQVVPAKKILLLTLQTFSTTGGIQKMSRTLGNVLQQIAVKNGWQFKLWSGYDNQDDADSKYIASQNFKGFNKARARFAADAVRQSLKFDTIILSHVNLAPIGWLAKALNPSCKVWLIAHGIEVWRPLSFFKKSIVTNCDKIICVSNFTKQKMIELHQVNHEKCAVLNNALDTSIKPPATFDKPAYLLERYKLTTGHKVVFTLTRLASTEQYKGYEQVIKAVSNLKSRYPEIKYLLSGKYDKLEEIRIKQLIETYAVQNQVIVTGFIDETELQDHFLLADLFVLPSKKEGFGIVFIEALACGLPVICGNEDGSLDAIRNGELGTAINADDVDELENAITLYLNTQLTPASRKLIQEKCLLYFSANDYRIAIEKMLING